MLALLRLLVWLLVAAAWGACDGLLDPSQLDHPRILAARATPANLAASEVAALDLLVASGDGAVTIATPAAVELSLDATRLGLNLEACPDAPFGTPPACVRAPDAERMATARRAAGLADDAELVVDVLLRVDLDGEPRVASKQLRLGTARPPLPSPTVTIDGLAIEADAATWPAGDAPLVLEASVPGRGPDASPLDVDWATSAGELDDADDARATLRRPEADGADDATVVVVVRDEHGNVAWRVLALRPATTARSRR